MHNRFLAILGIGVALVTASSIPANANDITGATATASCGPPTGFNATFTGKNLNKSHQYDVNYKITFTPPSPGSPIVVTGSLEIPNNTSGNFSVSVSKIVPLTSGVTYTLTGSATLRDDTASKDRNTIAISFTNSAQQITCGQQGLLTRSCRASALRVDRVLFVEPVVANAKDNPCDTDSKSLLSVSVLGGSISADVLTATTADPDPDGSTPDKAVGNVERSSILGSLGVTTGVLNAQATVNTTGGKCVLKSQSSVASATVLTVPISCGTLCTSPINITIPLVGVLHLNATLGGLSPTSGAPDPNKITQRALWLEVTSSLLPGVQDVILSEASTDCVSSRAAGIK